MASTLWTKVAALSIGTAISSTLVIFLPPVDMACVRKHSTGGVHSTVDPIRARGRAHSELVIASRNQGTPEEWWGSYGHSNGHEGCRLELGPEGFYFEASGCFGTTEVAYGKIASVEDTHIRLEMVEHVIGESTPARNGRQRFRMSADLYVVPWGEERLIVPAEQMVEFCSLAKAGGWDSMKYADYPHKQPPDNFVRHMPELSGLPDVPDAFRKYLPE